MQNSREQTKKYMSSQLQYQRNLNRGKSSQVSLLN